MPIVSAIILVAIAFAFIAFGVILAWGEYQTRNVGQRVARYAGTRTPAPSLKLVVNNGERERGVREEAKTRQAQQR